MRVTPRAAEVKAVVGLLESDQFDSADALAKAVIKQVGELFAERDWYAWVYRESPDAYYLPWGPFSSDSEAKKFAGKYVDMLAGEHMILKLYSTAALADGVTNGRKQPSMFCAGCNHSLISHQHPKIQPRCAVRSCKCKRSTSE